MSEEKTTVSEEPAGCERSEGCEGRERSEEHEERPRKREPFGLANFRDRRSKLTMPELAEMSDVPQYILYFGIDLEIHAVGPFEEVIGILYQLYRTIIERYDIETLNFSNFTEFLKVEMRSGIIMIHQIVGHADLCERLAKKIMHEKMEERKRMAERVVREQREQARAEELEQQELEKKQREQEMEQQKSKLTLEQECRKLRTTFEQASVNDLKLFVKFLDLASRIPEVKIPQYGPNGSVKGYIVSKLYKLKKQEIVEVLVSEYKDYYRATTSIETYLNNFREACSAQ
jgi:hypothetical protein